MIDIFSDSFWTPVATPAPTAPSSSYKIEETSDSFALYLNVPGNDMSDVDVSVKTNSAGMDTLMVTAKKSIFGPGLSNMFELDTSVDVAAITAKTHGGIMKVTAPKVKPDVKTIKIKVSDEKINDDFNKVDKKEATDADAPSPGDSEDIEVTTVE